MQKCLNRITVYLNLWSLCVCSKQFTFYFLQVTWWYERVCRWFWSVKENLQRWLLQTGPDSQDACQMDRCGKPRWPSLHGEKWCGRNCPHSRLHCSLSSKCISLYNWSVNFVVHSILHKLPFKSLLSSPRLHLFSQVTFIYVALLTIQIVSKQLHNIKLGK